MSAPVRIALFALLLAAALGSAAAVGAAVDPADPTAAAERAGTHAEPAGGTHAQPAAGGHAEPAGGGHASGSGDRTALPGLAAAQDGLRLQLADPRPPRGGRVPLAFRIVDADGRAVRSFDIAHDRRMHLIVVRRDLEGFQHLHPAMAADGTWRADVDLGEGGTYRVFADFTRDGTQHTLGSDVQVAGRFVPRAVPAPSTTARDDRGLEVRLRSRGSRAAFDVLRDGRVVNAELQPYLGARGHLVTLRTGDLAYLHTHPDGDELAFDVELPSAGTYRMWVQFRLAGRIHTAAFTQEHPS